MHELTTADRIAMWVGGGLVVLGTFVIGLLDMIFGAGHPVTSEGDIVHDALVPLEIRSYIVLAGLAIWAIYAIYRLLLTTPQGADPA